MKKKILICVHNYFALSNLFNTLSDLKNTYDLTILTTNYQLSSEELKIKKNNYGYKIFFLEFYNKNFKRDLFSIFKTHFQIISLKKIIDFNDFDLCLSDGKFFIWQRIVLENLLNKKCIQVGLTLDATLLPLDRFKKLLDKEKIDNVIGDLHKLRQIKKANTRSKNFFKKIFNVYNRYLDVFIDRFVLSWFFYRKNFRYNQNDFRLMENSSFEFKITFVKSSYIFWNNFYKNKIYLANLKNKCRCRYTKSHNNKILFISGNIWSPNFFDKNQIDSKLKNLFKIFEKLLKKYPKIEEIDFRHHPEESELNYQYINKILKSHYNLKFNVSNNKIPLEDIACKYELAVGMLSGALFYLKKSCENLKVHSYRSLNEIYWGKNYFLKFLGENIDFYDDTGDVFVPEDNIYKDLENIEKYDFKFLIDMILKIKLKNI